jgi:hypothetical protein
MQGLEEILDECLEQIASGEFSLEQCLARHPLEAAQLEPLLTAAAEVQDNPVLQPSPYYKARARSELLTYMQAHPRSPQAEAGFLRSPGWRIAFSLVILIVTFMISGTAYAQGSIPGDSFYGWKITSERAWRVFSRDPIGIDLVLAERRVSEYLLVSDDPERRQRALDGYGEVLVRLKSETDTNSLGRVVPVLKHHEKSLNDSGIRIPALDEFLGQQAGGTVLPATLPAGVFTPQPSP